MRKAVALAVALINLVGICRAEPRWCSVSKRDPSNTVVYAPISVGARVQGEARALIIYKPNGKVERAEHISGVLMLSQPLEEQLSRWRLRTKATGDEVCQTLMIAVFSLHPPAKIHAREKVEVSLEPNTVRITISTNYRELETDETELKRSKLPGQQLEGD
jgi:hypothetical protein